MSRPRRALIDDPADEPDEITDRPWLALAGRLVLMSSHQLNEVQATADDIVVINKGRLLAQLWSSSSSPRNEISSRSSSPCWNSPHDRSPARRNSQDHHHPPVVDHAGLCVRARWEPCGAAYPATPDRLQVLLAKAVSLVIFGLVYGVASVAAGVLVATPFVLTRGDRSFSAKPTPGARSCSASCRPSGGM